ncbi:jacalin-like lectin [Streptomyces sp. NPDC048254]|uniref:jacalin-like lectin n=1 Tax=Streptomyces sp. NPDC048254 TaxID=3365525 RepID=UPI00370FF8B2
MAHGYVRSDVYGGGGGGEFADNLTEASTLTKVIIHHGAAINSLQCVWRKPDGSTLAGAVYGAGGGTRQEILLEEGEAINEVRGSQGWLVTQLSFRTNRGRSFGPFGSDRGDSDFKISGNDHGIMGFNGRAGWFIDALGVFTAVKGSEEVVRPWAGVFLPVPDQQRDKGRSRYWVFHKDQYRPIDIIEIADGGTHKDRVAGADRSVSAWSSLSGIDRVRAVLPVPDRQRVGGKSRYWVFHKDQYRVIEVDDGPDYGDRMPSGDRPISTWPALKGVGQIDAILPVPDHQQIGGKSRYWVFHKDQYRVIEIDDGTAHEDRVSSGDRPLSTWPALDGVERISAILPVPDRQLVGGKSRYWVFHKDQYRVIEIDAGAAHDTRVVTGDRPVRADWTSLPH